MPSPSLFFPFFLLSTFYLFFSRKMNGIYINKLNRSEIRKRSNLIGSYFL